jgi:flagellar motor switch/type III secretory pathway protein FliN
MIRGEDAVIPLMLLGDSRRRLLAEHVRASAERWRRAWADDPQPRLSVEISAGESFAGRWSSQSGFRARTAQGMTLSLFVAARCLPVIAGVRPQVSELIDRPVDPASLAGRLEEEALRHLAREILATARAQMASFERVPLGIRQAALAHHALASITLGEADATFSVALDPHLVAATLPPQAAFRHDERVESRRVAIAEETVAVEAMLGQTEVSIRDLAQLAVGDVIVMDELLSDSASLQIQGGGRVGRIALGRFDGRRAAQFKGKLQ